MPAGRFDGSPDTAEGEPERGQGRPAQRGGDQERERQLDRGVGDLHAAAEAAERGAGDRGGDDDRHDERAGERGEGHPTIDPRQHGAAIAEELIDQAEPDDRGRGRAGGRRGIVDREPRARRARARRGEVRDQGLADHDITSRMSSA